MNEWTEGDVIEERRPLGQVLGLNRSIDFVECIHFILNFLYTF